MARIGSEFPAAEDGTSPGGHKAERQDRCRKSPLCARLCDGDPEALATVTGIIGRVIRTRGYYVPFDERADVAQEAMTDLVKAVRRTRFATDHDFQGFVRMIAYRRCIDWMRQARKKSSLAPGARELFGPDDAVFSKERRVMAMDVFGQLKKPCQEIIALKVSRAMTYADMSQLLGRSEGALRTQFSHCLGQARVLLDRTRRRRRLVKMAEWRRE